MKRMSGLDAAFLYLETPSTPMHTMSVLLLGEGRPQLTVEAIEDRFLDRMRHLPSLRQRVWNIPLAIDHPVLVDDPDFDIRNHVMRVHWERPGTFDDVDWAAGLLGSRLLPRDKPLWQVWWIDHLEKGQSALVTKVHHALIDGVSGAQFMAQLFDTQPVARTPSRRPSFDSCTMDAAPRRSALAVRAMLNQTRRTWTAAQEVGGWARAVRDRRGASSTNAGEAAESRRLRDRLFARTEFNGSLSRQRSISRASASLEDLRSIRKAFDVTINDALLAAVTIALRRHLRERGPAPIRPLMAAIPVSTRQSGDEIGGNHVSTWFVRLPVYLTEPERVIRTLRRNTSAAKQSHAALPASWVETALDLAPPYAVQFLARQHERLRLADFHPPPCNLIVSNFAGPPIPLYFAGAPIRAAYPFGPLMNGSGLNLTAMSYNGRLDLGLIACPRRMPEAARFLATVTEAVLLLRATAQNAVEREACFVTSTREPQRMPRHESGAKVAMAG